MATSKRTRSDGDRSRSTILSAAVRLATAEGLERLSLARLAEATGMSKSGVFGLFGSKLELQLATIETAREMFIAEVVSPALEHPQGRARLLALAEGFLEYVGRRTWPEGCFFASVAAEVGADDGPLRSRVAQGQRQWVQLLAHNARLAADAGELPAGSDPDRLALEISTMLTGADIGYLLHRDPGILDAVRTALRSRLAS